MHADLDWPQWDEEYLMAIASMAVPAHLRAKFDMADVVQDALLRIHNNPGVLEGRSAAEREAYLRKALASALADQIRHYDFQGRRAVLERSLEAALDDSSARLGQWLAAEQTSPSQRASREEQLARLAQALARLPKDQREVVRLHHLEKRTMSQIAEALGRSPTSIAGLIRRGMKALRTMLVEGEANGP